MLDEAYSPIGGDCHLTPYSRNQLKKARGGENGEEKYLKMKAFNNALSSQRITIERAFGMLIRRFGILAKPLSYNIATNSKIAYVCAQLHNRNVDRWVKTGKGRGCLQPLSGSRDAEAFLELQLLSRPIDESFPSDDFIVETYTNCSCWPNNAAENDGSRAARLNDTDRRSDITQYLFNAGIRFDLQSDNDFTFAEDF